MLEYTTGLGEFFGYIKAHTYVLRPLAREQKGCLCGHCLYLWFSHFFTEKLIQGDVIFS